MEVIPLFATYVKDMGRGCIIILAKGEPKCVADYSKLGADLTNLGTNMTSLKGKETKTKQFTKKHTCQPVNFSNRDNFSFK